VDDGNEVFEMMSISLNSAHAPYPKSGGDSKAKTDKNLLHGTIWGELLHREQPEISYCDSAGNPLYPEPAVNVLVLGFENGYHYRITIG
jgi:hypothetical protein